MAGSGNPPAVFVQVIIGCVTAKAGLWHRELRLPVFLFGTLLKPFAQNNNNFIIYPLNPGDKWYIISGSIVKKDEQLPK